MLDTPTAVVMIVAALLILVVGIAHAARAPR